MVKTHLLFLLFLSLNSLNADAQGKKPFHHESEASIVNISGNTQTESYLFKQTSEYSFQKNLLILKGRYLRVKNFSTETARLWDLSLRYEYELTDLWSYFLQHGAESDPFAGFTQRDNSDIGAKYFLIKDTPKIFFLEAGYRYSKTLSSLNTEVSYKNSGRLYLEYHDDITDKMSWRFWVEYLADIKDSQDYLVNYEPSFSISMSSSFSLKVSYLTRYHNIIVIPEEKKEDSTFTTTLVFKL